MGKYHWYGLRGAHDEGELGVMDMDVVRIIVSVKGRFMVKNEVG
jgi:hypothetical protein